MAPSSQLSQSPLTTSTNSVADSYRVAWSTGPTAPKFPATSGIPVVTTFHPARPPLSLSSDAKIRPMLNGAEHVLEAVATSPTLDVCGASAACSAGGANPSAWPGG